MELMRSQYIKRGFNEVITPNIFNKELWETSGHWQHYAVGAGSKCRNGGAPEGPRAVQSADVTPSFNFTSQDDMFTFEVEKEDWAMKPMNCPSHWSVAPPARHAFHNRPFLFIFFSTRPLTFTQRHVWLPVALLPRAAPALCRCVTPFARPADAHLLRARSGRELIARPAPPLPLCHDDADFGVLHRNELSGALTGLTRVRRFQQDDAHIFCEPHQVSRSRRRRRHCCRAWRGL